MVLSCDERVEFVDTLGSDDEARPMCVMYSSARGIAERLREKVFVYMNNFVVHYEMTCHMG